MSNIIFIRHGQHLEENNDKLIDNLGITCSGVKEVQAAIKSIPTELHDMSALGFNHRRAIGSLSIALQSIHQGEVTHIATDNNLDYINPPDGEFKNLLLDAYYKKKNLRFLKEISDDYDSDIDPISSYSRMASVAAQLTLEKNNTIFCGREFIFVSMMGKITNKLLGHEAENDFIDWYESNMEEQKVSREIPAMIKVHKNTVDIKYSHYCYDIKRELLEGLAYE